MAFQSRQQPEVETHTGPVRPLHEDAPVGDRLDNVEQRIGKPAEANIVTIRNELSARIGHVVRLCSKAQDVTGLKLLDPCPLSVIEVANTVGEEGERDRIPGRNSRCVDEFHRVADALPVRACQHLNRRCTRGQPKCLQRDLAIGAPC